MKNYVLLCLTICAMVGCDSKGATDKLKSKPTTASEDHDHGDSHDHGKTVDHSKAGHSHGSGPHGGVVADWGGGKYHVEIIFDHGAKSVTAYILGGDEKTPVPIDAEMIEVTLKMPEVSITLVPMAQATNTAGLASVFVGSHDMLSSVQDYEGAITGVIEGTPYTGEFQE